MSVVTLGRYQLQEQIAAGGMGEVWRAVDTVLDRPVAVKFLRAEHSRQAEAVARFRAEARHAGSLSHPAIASIHDYGEAGRSRLPYLVMELVDGPSLAAVLSAGPLGAARTMDVIAQAAAGLAAAHAAGLVHCDVKPGNLLLDQHSHVKITDFGIADITGSTSVTAAGAVTGTPGYLAPERAAGAPATPASDLYSLGVVAYECLAGRPPFAGTPQDIARAHRDRPLPPLPGTVPADVASLIADLTAKDPAGRPATAGQVATRAARIRDALPGAVADVVAPGTACPASPTLADDPLPGMPAANPRTWHALLPRRSAALPVALAAAAVVAAGSLGLLAGGMLTTTTPPSPPPHAASKVTSIDMASFPGKPVSSVRRELRQLGFIVRVQWQRTGLAPPGTVVSVRPRGQARIGSLVTLTGALAPRHVPGPGDRNAGVQPDRTGNGGWYYHNRGWYGGGNRDPGGGGWYSGRG